MNDKCPKCGGNILYYTKRYIYKFVNGEPIKIGEEEAKIQCGKCGWIDKINTAAINELIKRKEQG